ncbi:MAG: response regulator [Magnetovibrionaceae bacterium]
MSAEPRTLIVEDDALIALATEEACRRAGLAATHVSAEAALDVLNEPGGVTAVVLDINMPGIDGVEFIRRFPPAAVQGQVPVFLVSGADGAIMRAAETLASLQKVNVVTCFSKPFDVEILTEAIRSLDT